jgi:hypothetical protein
MSWLRAFRDRPRLTLGIGVAVVLVVAGVVTAVVLLREPAAPDLSKPEGVAYATGQALSSKDPEKLRAVSCDPANFDGDTSASAVAVLEQPDVTIEAHADGQPAVRGNTATAKLDLTITYQGGTQDVPVTLQLTRRGAGWCLADLT